MEDATASHDPGSALRGDGPSFEPEAPRKGGFGGAISGVLVAIGFALVKLKGVIFLTAAKLKLLLVNPFEGFGVAQFAWAGGSMIVTVLAYAMKFKLTFAFGFVLITAIHEVGHALVIRAKGLRAGALVFIPFVGGAVTLRNQPRSAWDDAHIGLAGPLAGTLASIGCVFLYEGTGRALYLALASAGFLLNLFNLLPIGPLDGGRIAAAITKWMWLLGVGILTAMMIYWRSPMLIFILILGLFQIYRGVRRPRRLFYKVTVAQRTAIATIYFALVLFLGYATVVTHEQLLALPL